MKTLSKGAPEAQIITLEYNHKHASIAKQNFKNSDLGKNIHLVEGDAKEILETFVKDQEEPFDLIFLDANKEDYPIYLPLLLALSKSHTLLLTDNLIPKASPINQPLGDDLTAIHIYEYNKMLASNPQMDSILATTIVGDSGRVDALGISVIK